MITPDNDAAAWMQDNLNAMAQYGRKPTEPYVLSDFDKRAVGVLAKAFRMGIYNVPVDWKKVEWRLGGAGVRFTMSSPRELSTWDFDTLSRLVIAAHEECIRISIEGAPGSKLKILMFPRLGREGRMSERHPTIEQAVADYRS